MWYIILDQDFVHHTSQSSATRKRLDSLVFGLALCGTEICCLAAFREARPVTLVECKLRAEGYKYFSSFGISKEFLHQSLWIRCLWSSSEQYVTYGASS